MADVAFDTLAFARRMERVGFTREQAEAMAEEQAKLIDERLATKADIEGLRQATKADIDGLRQATKLDIASLRADMERLHDATKVDIETLRLTAQHQSELLRRDLTIRLGGIVVAAVAAGSTIVTLFARFMPPH